MVKKSLTTTLNETGLLSTSKPLEILSRLFEESLPILNADLIILYPYNQDEGVWQKPVAVGNFLNPSVLEETFPDSWISDSKFLSQTLYIPEVTKYPTVKMDIFQKEGIKSCVIVPISAEDKNIGMLFISSRHLFEFDNDDLAKINFLAHQISDVLRINQYGTTNDAELIQPNILRIRSELPSLLTVNKYLQIISRKLWAIELIYLVFAVIESGNKKATQDFIRLAGKHLEKGTISKAQIRALYVSANIEPLILVSTHYGSPVLIDLLGVGKVVEILRDTIKDLLWRGKHEKYMAELERQSKEEEINKMRLEAENFMVDIVAKKLDILKKTNNLKLSERNKKIIIKELLPYMALIGDGSSTKSLTSRSDKAISKTKKNHRKAG